MKKKFKGFYLLVSSVVIALLHLPFAFAKSATGNKTFSRTAVRSEVNPGPSPLPAVPSALRSVYDSLHLNLKGLSQQAYQYARQGFDKLIQQGKLANQSIISIIDFSLPSNKKRLFVIDLENYKVLFNTLVAHGKNTGYENAVSFSNQESSFKSSPGFYVTQETYEGKNGYSLKLEGLERGINDKALERGIVVHGAPYVSDERANTPGGFVGRSQGCPAVPVQVSRPIINTIKNGTCLFIYHPSYVDRSVILN
jgi:hypothetical protein